MLIEWHEQILNFCRVNLHPKMMNEFQQKLKILNFIPNSFSKKQLYVILNKIPVPLVLVDNNQHILFANKELMALGNFSKLNKSTCRNSICKNIFCPCPAISNLESSNPIKTGFVRKDGSHGIVSKIAHKLTFDNSDCSLIFITDITKEEELKAYQNLIIKQKSEAEEKAKNEAKKFEFLFENLSDAVFLLNDKGDFIKVNKKALEHLEYSLEELLNMNIRSIKEPEIHWTIDNTISTIKQRGNLIFETKHITKSGKVKEVEVSSSYINLGGMDYLFSCVRDITKRKKLEQNLIISTEKAKESNKLKSAFLNIISHQIRTPLNGILGFVDVLENYYENLDPVKRKEYFNFIRESGNNLLHTVEEIIDVSKLNSGVLELQSDWFQIRENIEPIIEELKTKYHKNNNSFSLKIDDYVNFLSIKTDKNMLMRVLRNLLDNIFKFNINGNLNLTIKHCNNQIYFSIKDDGLGIPEKYIDIIFEPFTKTESCLNQKIEGNGLGLTISKKLVNYLGGNLKVKSTTGKGTKFYFSIPYMGVHSFVKIKQNDTLKYSLKDKTILIAEDDLITFKLLETILKSKECQVLHASTGKEATDYFKEYTTKIDLIIMDINMPVMDGITATQNIRTICQKVPIIAHSAFAHDACKNNYLDYGFNAFLTKPTEKDKLLQLLKESFKN